jgi:hypothetical protein
MPLMRKSIAGILLALLALAGLLLFFRPSGPGREDLEKEIRASIINETAALASLTSIFRVIYTSFQERIIVSDETYFQEDEAALDYGFRIDEGNIKVVFQDGRRILQVRLPRGERLSLDRVTLKKVKTHADYHPQADIDAEINRELARLEKEYGAKALEEAAQNIKNFFRVVAETYGLELDWGQWPGLSPGPKAGEP